MQNENKYTDAAGVQYVSKKATYSCAGCAHQFAVEDCAEAPDCVGSHGIERDVIWVKAEAGSQA